MRIGSKTGMAMLGCLLTAAAFAQVSPSKPRTRSIAAVGSPGYLGIGAKDIDSERAKALKLSETRGAEVMNVMADSPAAKAGFKEGDVVLEYNGQRVEGIDQLTRMVGETPAGRQVKILVSRSGQNVTLTPTLESGHTMAWSGGGSWNMPEITIPAIPPMELPRMQMSYQNPMLGITGESLAQEDQFAEFFGVKDGVLVKSVAKDSPAEKAGIKAGDVIVKVDESKVGTTREITSVLRQVRSKKTITVIVVRNKKEMPITVTVEASTVVPGVRAFRFGPGIEIPPVELTIPEVVVQMPRVVFTRPATIQPMVIKPLVISPKIRVLKLSTQDRVI